MSAAAVGSLLQLQVDALMHRVQQYRDQRCGELRRAAADQVRELLRSARAEARASVHDAIAHERVRLDQGARQSEARAALTARQQAQREIRALLTHVWTELPALLAARWQLEPARRAWVEAALTESGQLLAGRSWTIECYSVWSESERRAAETFALARGARAIEWAHDQRLGAGLRVRAGSVVLDATVSGLLARSDAIESAFLAEYERD